MQMADEVLGVIADAYARLVGPRDLRLDDLLMGAALDSLKKLELIVTIEDHFGIDLLHRPELTELEKVSELIGLITSVLEASEGNG